MYMSGHAVGFCIMLCSQIMSRPSADNVLRKASNFEPARNQTVNHSTHVPVSRMPGLMPDLPLQTSDCEPH